MLQTESLVYFGCAATSILCLLLLARGYMQTRVRFLFWAALCFLGLTINNLLLLFDVVIYPELDLRPGRSLATFFALAAMLYGFLWDDEMWS